MTSEVETHNRINELEERIHKLEKIIINNEDALNINFDGYEDLSDQEINIIIEGEKEITKGTVKSLDEVLQELE